MSGSGDSGYSGSHSPVTGIRVARQALRLPPGAKVGTPVCLSEELDCCPETIEVTCGWPLSWTYPAGEILRESTPVPRRLPKILYACFSNPWFGALGNRHCYQYWDSVTPIRLVYQQSPPGWYGSLSNGLPNFDECGLGVRIPADVCGEVDFDASEYDGTTPKIYRPRCTRAGASRDTWKLFPGLQTSPHLWLEYLAWDECTQYGTDAVSDSAVGSRLIVSDRPDRLNVPPLDCFSSGRQWPLSLTATFSGVVGFPCLPASATLSFRRGCWEYTSSCGTEALRMWMTCSSIPHAANGGFQILPTFHLLCGKEPGYGYCGHTASGVTVLSTDPVAVLFRMTCQGTVDSGHGSTCFDAACISAGAGNQSCYGSFDVLVTEG